MSLLKKAKEILKAKDGINTVEIIIILAVLVGLILLFKDYITAFIQKIFDDLNKDTDIILNIATLFKGKIR